MAMLTKKVQPAKTAAIEEAKKTFAGYDEFIFADYRGMTVEQISSLRKKLREKESVLKVVKNNFARIAFKERNIDSVAELLKGPTVVAMGKEDSNVIAKTLFDFAKDNPVLTVKGAYVGNELFDAAKIEAFSKVPGKKELIAMLMSAMNGPARKLAATIKAYAEKKESEGGASPAKAEAATAEANAAPAETPATETPAAETPAAEVPAAN